MDRFLDKCFHQSGNLIVFVKVTPKKELSNDNGNKERKEYVYLFQWVKKGRAYADRILG